MLGRRIGKTEGKIKQNEKMMAMITEREGKQIW
jgi:hypothetical protein